MKKKDEKNPAQVMLTKAEFDVVNIAGITRGFRSVNLYLRDLLTKDITALKKDHKAPWIYGMRQYDWDNLSEYEKEKFLNQIGPVEPGGIDYLVAKAQGKIMDEIPVVGKNELL